VRTVGVDLSAEVAKTFVASIEWTSSGAVVTSVTGGVDNLAIVVAAKTADKTGIDCPFGWPLPFLKFVTDHMAGVVDPDERLPRVWRRDLAKRETDLFVHATTGLTPLSVSADLIAHVAFRCAALLAELSAAGVSVDRSGIDGAVAEVYPAASLRQWGLSHRGYKRRANAAVLADNFAAFSARAPWLRFDQPADAALCQSNDDAFDAVIAALAARAQAIGQTVAISAEQRLVGRSEGWVAIPLRGSLPRLA
jgi:hypothetical protein